MQHKRLPPEAFDFYASLGPGRSYQAVAAQFGVSKRTVSRTATDDDWSGRLGRVERKAQEQADKALGESLGDIRTRHQKGLRALFARAVEGLRNHQFRTAMEAARALEMAVKYERMTHGVLEGDKWDVHERAQVLREQIAACRATVPAPPEEEDGEVA